MTSIIDGKKMSAVFKTTTSSEESESLNSKKHITHLKNVIAQRDLREKVKELQKLCKQIRTDQFNNNLEQYFEISLELYQQIIVRIDELTLNQILDVIRCIPQIPKNKTLQIVILVENCLFFKDRLNLKDIESILIALNSCLGELNEDSEDYCQLCDDLPQVCDRLAECVLRLQSFWTVQNLMLIGQTLIRLTYSGNRFFNRYIDFIVNSNEKFTTFEFSICLYIYSRLSIHLKRDDFLKNILCRLDLHQFSFDCSNDIFNFIKIIDCLYRLNALTENFSLRFLEYIPEILKMESEYKFKSLHIDLVRVLCSIYKIVTEHELKSRLENLVNSLVNDMLDDMKINSNKKILFLSHLLRTLSEAKIINENLLSIVKTKSSYFTKSINSFLHFVIGDNSFNIISRKDMINLVSMVIENIQKEKQQTLHTLQYVKGMNNVKVVVTSSESGKHFRTKTIRQLIYKLVYSNIFNDEFVRVLLAKAHVRLPHHLKYFLPFLKKICSNDEAILDEIQRLKITHISTLKPMHDQKFSAELLPRDKFLQWRHKNTTAFSERSNHKRRIHLLESGWKALVNVLKTTVNHSNGLNLLGLLLFLHEKHGEDFDLIGGSGEKILEAGDWEYVLHWLKQNKLDIPSELLSSTRGGDCDVDIRILNPQLDENKREEISKDLGLLVHHPLKMTTISSTNPKTNIQDVNGSDFTINRLPNIDIIAAQKLNVTHISKPFAIPLNGLLNPLCLKKTNAKGLERSLELQKLFETSKESFPIFPYYLGEQKQFGNALLDKIGKVRVIYNIQKQNKYAWGSCLADEIDGESYSQIGLLTERMLTLLNENKESNLIHLLALAEGHFPLTHLMGRFSVVIMGCYYLKCSSQSQLANTIWEKYYYQFAKNREQIFEDDITGRWFKKVLSKRMTFEELYISIQLQAFAWMATDNIRMPLTSLPAVLTGTESSPCFDLYLQKEGRRYRLAFPLEFDQSLQGFPFQESFSLPFELSSESSQLQKNAYALGKKISALQKEADRCVRERQSWASYELLQLCHSLLPEKKAFTASLIEHLLCFKHQASAVSYLNRALKISTKPITEAMLTDEKTYICRMIDHLCTEDTYSHTIIYKLIENLIKYNHSNVYDYALYYIGSSSISHFVRSYRVFKLIETNNNPSATLAAALHLYVISSKTFEEALVDLFDQYGSTKSLPEAFAMAIPFLHNQDSLQLILKVYKKHFIREDVLVRLAILECARKLELQSLVDESIKILIDKSSNFQNVLAIATWLYQRPEMKEYSQLKTIVDEYIQEIDVPTIPENSLKLFHQWVSQNYARLNISLKQRVGFFIRYLDLDFQTASEWWNKFKDYSQEALKPFAQKISKACSQKKSNNNSEDYGKLLLELFNKKLLAKETLLAYMREQSAKDTLSVKMQGLLLNCLIQYPVKDKDLWVSILSKSEAEKNMELAIQALEKADATKVFQDSHEMHLTCWAFVKHHAKSLKGISKAIQDAADVSLNSKSALPSIRLLMKFIHQNDQALEVALKHFSDFIYTNRDKVNVLRGGLDVFHSFHDVLKCVEYGALHESFETCVSRVNNILPECRQYTFVKPRRSIFSSIYAFWEAVTG